MKTSLLAVISLLLLVIFDATLAFQKSSPGLSSRICTAFYEGSVARVRSKQTFKATRLNYRDAGDEFSQENSRAGESSVTKTQGGWLSRLASNNKSKGERKQDVVDDYLEFLEKRYQRLHSDETESSGEPKFSAWKWLMQGSDDAEQSLQEQSVADQENALYALGIAGLASQRLLQKHQLPLPRNSLEQESVQVSSSSGEVVSVLEEKSTLNVSRLFARIALQRRLLLHYQNRKLRAFAKLLIRTLRTGPGNVLKHALELGGGKKTIVLTATALATLIFVLARPLAQTIVREGASQA